MGTEREATFIVGQLGIRCPRWEDAAIEAQLLGDNSERLCCLLRRENGGQSSAASTCLWTGPRLRRSRGWCPAAQSRIADRRRMTCVRGGLSITPRERSPYFRCGVGSERLAQFCNFLTCGYSKLECESIQKDASPFPEMTIHTLLTSKLMHEARGARAVSVNFRKFSLCIARAPRTRGFDSLVSLPDVGNP